MNENFFHAPWRHHWGVRALSKRYAGGTGGDSGGETAAQVGSAAASSAAGAAGEEPAAVSGSSAAAAESEKKYTDADLEAAKQAALTDYQKQQETAKDYDKMTPEQKVAYLEAQRENDKRTAYAVQQLAAAGLPQDLLQAVEGKEAAAVDAIIQVISGKIQETAAAMMDAKLKEAGYNPQSGSAQTKSSGDSLADVVSAALGL